MKALTPLVLSIDQGTTSTRAIIFNQAGQIVAKSQKELDIYTPKSGWIEQDANQIWDDVVAVCRQALAQVDIDDVIGMGITNQRETTIIWDKKTGEPIHNAIVWQDRRTAKICADLKSHADMIQSKTGLVLDPYFSATKIRWILDKVGRNYNLSDLAFGTVDSYVLWKLTEGVLHATDISNAARTMLFNIHDEKWDEDLCDVMGVPQNMLPTVMDNCADFGQCNLFGKSLPILSMAGDQQAATFGQNCFDKGMVKATYGTGCFALMNTGDNIVQSSHKLLSTIAWRIDGKTTYALEGSIFVAGSAVQFLRDNFEFFDKADESENIAVSVDDSDGVVFVTSFTGLGAPYWNPDVRGALLGLSRGTNKAHIVRSCLEAQAYQTRDLMDAMRNDVGGVLSAMRVDGGLVANDFACQAIANQTGMTIERPVNTEATVWGVAAMAFLQAGVFQSFDDIQKIYQLEQSFPSQKNVECDDDYHRWQQAVKAVQLFAVE